MMLVLSLNVPNHFGKLSRSHRRRRVIRRPAQTQDVSRETARRVTAPTLEELHEAWQVDAWGGANQHVDVRLEDGEGHDIGVFARGGATEVLSRKSRVALSIIGRRSRVVHARWM